MENEKVIRLTESQFNNVIKNTINEAIEAKKQSLNESWITELTMQMGDYLYTHTPQLFNAILKSKNEWANIQPEALKDPNTLQNAKMVVGRLVSMFSAVGGLVAGFAGGVGTYNLMKKYAPQIEKLKASFFSKFAGQ